MILKGYNDFTSDIELVSYDELKNDFDLKQRYLSWLNDTDVTISLGSNELMRGDLSLDFIESSFERFTKAEAQGFFIKYGLQDMYIGTAKVDKISIENSSAEFGIMIGEKQLWGNGLGEKAYLILLRYAFETLKLNRVWGGADASNMGMQKLFLKVGFKEEGRLRQVSFFNGKYIDNVRYAILKDEYRCSGV